MENKLKSFTNVNYKMFVDCGNRSIKAKGIAPNGEEKPIEIPTVVSETTYKSFQGSYLVENYEGKTYVVGDTNLSTNINLSLDKMDITHKLATLVAIHQVVNTGEVVDLFIGLPIGSYFNSEYRDKYIAYYSQPNTHTLQVNGVKKQFTINKVVTIPESVGHIFNYPQENLVGVVDIGFTTIDGAVFKDLAPLTKTIFSLVDGANPFKTFVRDELNNRLMLNIQDYQMDEILTKGMFGAKAKESEKIIYECKEKYLKKIINEMVKHGWEVQTLPVMFTGGGSLLLESLVKEVATFGVSENCVNDNLDGFVKMGVMLNE